MTTDFAPPPLLPPLESSLAQARSLEARMNSVLTRLAAETARANAAVDSAREWESAAGQARASEAYWRARCLDAEAELHDRPTVELPRVAAELEPPVRSRSRRRGRHQ